MKLPRIIANVRVGKPDVDPGKPSHVTGVRQGNAKGLSVKAKGFRPNRDGLGANVRASFSTGINPRDREPIDPRMPRLFPA